MEKLRFIFMRRSLPTDLLEAGPHSPSRAKTLTPNYFYRKKWYHQISFSKVLGVIMLICGILIMLGIGFSEWLNKKPDPNLSSLMSIGFLLIMLGIAFFFPDMLKSGATDNTSSMRVAVYMIVCVFVLLCVKYGWNCYSFADLKLDSTWAYILGAALGSKAIQTFGESKNPKAFVPIGGNQGSQNTGPSSISSASVIGNSFAPVHDPSTINNRPPLNPPFQ
jgi:uncharacterized membrane protein HdeD (DUF308 family)